MNETVEMSKLRGEISILKEELQRLKIVAEREKNRANWNYEQYSDLQQELEKTKEQRDELDKEITHLHGSFQQRAETEREQSASTLQRKNWDRCNSSRARENSRLLLNPCELHPASGRYVLFLQAEPFLQFCDARRSAYDLSQAGKNRSRLCHAQGSLGRYRGLRNSGFPFPGKS